MPKNLFTPNSYDENLKTEVQCNLNQKSQTLSGMKRGSNSNCKGNNDITFEPNWAHNRLFSNTSEDNLEAQGGLKQSESPSANWNDVPLTTLAGVISSLKPRGRTISSASDSTIFSNVGTKPKCSKCGQPSESLVNERNKKPISTLTPNPQSGKFTNFILLTKKMVD